MKRKHRDAVINRIYIVFGLHDSVGENSGWVLWHWGHSRREVEDHAFLHFHTSGYRQAKLVVVTVGHRGITIKTLSETVPPKPRVSRAELQTRFEETIAMLEGQAKRRAPKERRAIMEMMNHMRKLLE